MAIVAFFGFTATNFFTAPNFINVIVQMAGVTMLAYGVVFVLLLGEIDLSIGYLSGIAALAVAELQLPGSSHDYPGIIAIALAIILTGAIGLGQGTIVAKVGVPSFVVTLAGLLIWQGVILHVLEDRGVIIIEDSMVNDLANYFFSDTAGWIIAAVDHRDLRGRRPRRRDRTPPGRRGDGSSRPRARQGGRGRGRGLRLGRDLQPGAPTGPSARRPADDRLPRRADVSRQADAVRPPRLRRRR